jgi:hypothetical protein
MIFLDSSFVIALADTDDQFHEKAVVSRSIGNRATRID